MGEVKCSPGPWKAIENSWQYTTIYDAHDREICRLDLERFEDLNEETQDKYESIQRADAAAIVRACDHDAALRRAKADGLRLAVQEHRCWEDVLRTEYRNVPTFEAWIDARAAQIEEGE